MVTKEDIPVEAEVMTKIWELVKKYYLPRPGDDYWDGLLDDAAKIAGMSKLGEALALGVVGYLEAKSTGKK